MSASSQSFRTHSRLLALIAFFRSFLKASYLVEQSCRCEDACTGHRLLVCQSPPTTTLLRPRRSLVRTSMTRLKESRERLGQVAVVRPEATYPPTLIAALAVLSGAHSWFGSALSAPIYGAFAPGRDVSWFQTFIPTRETAFFFNSANGPADSDSAPLQHRFAKGRRQADYGRLGL